MKKWWVFFVVTAVALVGIAFVLGRQEDAITVKTRRLTPQKVEQKVNCSGVVEAADKQPVLLDVPCVIKEVLVEEGQSVEEGDPLFVVDKEATRQTTAMADGRSALALAAMAETVTAPASGVVALVDAKEGETMGMGEPCVVIIPRESIRVRIAIKEKDVAGMKEGLSVKVTGDGFRKASYRGRLTDISSTANTLGSGETVVEGVVTLDEGQVDDSMRLGLTAKVAVITDVREAGVVVPYEAVQEDEKGVEYIYVLEDGVARRRNLTVEKELSTGLLLADNALSDVLVITQPERVSDDGMLVTEQMEVSE